MSRALEPSTFDFEAARDDGGQSWKRANPTEALIERAGTHAWRVFLPDGDAGHLVLLALNDGEYVGRCDCKGYEYGDGPCAHLCTVRQADWQNQHLGTSIEDVNGQLVQVAEANRDEKDVLAGRADEVAANGGTIR